MTSSNQSTISVPRPNLAVFHQTQPVAAPAHTRSALAALQAWLPLAGRIALGAIFAISAVGKLATWEGTAGFMSAKGFPMAPLFLAGAIAFEFGGALSLFAGYKARWGALALLAFLVPATLIFHNFWAYTGAEQQMQMLNFLKNVAIGGGLLTVVAHGAGPVSVDARK